MRTRSELNRNVLLGYVDWNVACYGFSGCVRGESCCEVEKDPMSGVSFGWARDRVGPRRAGSAANRLQSGTTRHNSSKPFDGRRAAGQVWDRQELGHEASTVGRGWNL